MIVPSWEQTLVALHRAETVNELWSVLLVGHGIRSSAMWDEPYHLFCRFHEHHPRGAATTAALLCTDHRWRKGTHILIEHLAESGFIDQAGLDQLADWFLADELHVAVPEEAFDGAEIVLADLPTDVDGPALAAPASGLRRARGDLFFARSIWPPLRRWAARHAVGLAPDRWRELLEVARSFRSRDGAAIATGVMDAATHIPGSEQIEALAEGLAWGSGTVRLAALPGVADLHGIDVARAHAADDPSAKVRAWATNASAAEGEPAADGGEPIRPPAMDSAGQPTLF